MTPTIKNTGFPLSLTDPLGHNIYLPNPPQRIVSLVPSQTELLYDLGLGNQIVGQTQFCIHPKEAFKTATRVGGTKNFRVQQIQELKPDLIIGNQEENEPQRIQELMQAFPVWISQIYTLTDALEMITTLGTLTQTRSKAQKLAQNIQNQFRTITPLATPKRVLYLIWKKPWMAAGRHTFINNMIERAGLVNVCEPLSRYPELSTEQIVALNPEVVLLSSEPYPFSEKHKAELSALLPNSQIILADGELLSWYGSRLQYTAPYLQDLAHTLS